jgi:CHAT domain-containing protein
MAYEHAVSGERCSLKPLRCAEAEARMVGQVNAASKSLVGREATKEAVASAMGDFDALHFATHGLPCPEVPMLSSVALADGERLTVGEFLVRRLRASLVVLSACDTGIGQPTDGDDVVGFSRSLLAAGVQAIVVSLWPVDDLVTSLIMREFYQRLQTGKGASEALRESQLMARQLQAGELDRYAWDIQKGLRPDEAGQRPIAPQRRQGKSRDYSEPRFWAPFIYIGVR